VALVNESRPVWDGSFCFRCPSIGWTYNTAVARSWTFRPCPSREQVSHTNERDSNV
jgi:hypothetical protein